jgi:hypothetical protein
VGVTGRRGCPLRRRVGVRREVGVRERLLAEVTIPVGGRLSLAETYICLICLACSAGRGVRVANGGSGVFEEGNSTLSI